MKALEKMNLNFAFTRWKTHAATSKLAATLLREALLHEAEGDPICRFSINSTESMLCCPSFMRSFPLKMRHIGPERHTNGQHLLANSICRCALELSRDNLEKLKTAKKRSLRAVFARADKNGVGNRLTQDELSIHLRTDPELATLLSLSANVGESDHGVLEQVVHEMDVDGSSGKIGVQEFVQCFSKVAADTSGALHVYPGFEHCWRITGNMWLGYVDEQTHAGRFPTEPGELDRRQTFDVAGTDNTTPSEEWQYVGVSWDKRKSTWQVQINNNGNDRQLGSFADKETAARTYDSDARRLRSFQAHAGRFKLNFPTAAEEQHRIDTFVSPHQLLQKLLDQTADRAAAQQLVDQATCECSMSDFKQAVQTLEKAATLQPGSTRIVKELDTARQKLFESESEMRRTMVEACEALHTIAQTLLKEGKLSEALRPLKIEHALRPRDSLSELSELSELVKSLIKRTKAITELTNAGRVALDCGSLECVQRLLGAARDHEQQLEQDALLAKAGQVSGVDITLMDPSAATDSLHKDWHSELRVIAAAKNELARLLAHDAIHLLPHEHHRALKFAIELVSPHPNDETPNECSVYKEGLEEAQKRVDLHELLERAALQVQIGQISEAQILLDDAEVRSRNLSETYQMTDKIAVLRNLKHAYEKVPIVATVTELRSTLSVTAVAVSGESEDEAKHRDKILGEQWAKLTSTVVTGEALQCWVTGMSASATVSKLLAKELNLKLINFDEVDLNDQKAVDALALQLDEHQAVKHGYVVHGNPGEWSKGDLGDRLGRTEVNRIFVAETTPPPADLSAQQEAELLAHPLCRLGSSVPEAAVAIDFAMDKVWSLDDLLEDTGMSVFGDLIAPALQPYKMPPLLMWQDTASHADVGSWTLTKGDPHNVDEHSPPVCLTRRHRCWVTISTPSATAEQVTMCM